MDTADGYSSVAELVVFEPDGQGKVARLKIGNHTSSPVEDW